MSVCELGWWHDSSDLVPRQHGELGGIPVLVRALLLDQRETNLCVFWQGVEVTLSIAAILAGTPRAGC